MREGYKKTKLGVIPEDWEIMSLNRMMKENIIVGHLDGNHGKLYPKANEFTIGGVPYINANCIKNNRVDLSEAKYLPLKRAEKFKKGISKNDDVLFAHNGTVGPVALLKTDMDYVILSTTLTYYRTNEQKLSSRYLSYYISSEAFKRQYIRIMGQTTRNQVPITTQRTLYHIIPPIQEQKKIASILSSIDEYIEEVDGMVEDLKKLKKGLMQKLLTGQYTLENDKLVKTKEFKKTRLGMIPEHWEVKKIKSITTVTTGKTPPTKNKEYYGNGYPWVTPTDITSSKEINKTYRMLSDKGFKYTSVKLPKKTLLITCIASIGKNAILTTEGSCNQQINAMLPNEKIYNSEFMYYWISKNRNLFERYAGKTAVPILNKTSFENVFVAIPPLKEQENIATILSSIDIRTEGFLKEQRNLQQLKKGLMQQLLTGKKRVKINN